MTAGFLYSSELTRNILREDHVLRPMRLRLVYELLQAYGVFEQPGAIVLEPRLATEQELMTFHGRDYVEAVQSFSRGEDLFRQGRYGFSDSGDNTISEGMYEAASLAAGASLTAAEAVWNGDVDVAFNAGGGYHHAGPDFASGFCVFNDPVIAIKYLLERGLRVAYVDIDAHHGDGVQHAFYDSDRALTISLHQSGDYLFPGTGSVDEMGAGSGLGYSVNLPLYPHTNDEIYLWALNSVVVPLVKAFNPDVLATQLGMDPHFRDPITQLGLTVQGHVRLVEELGKLCPRWLAFGGGGYDVSAVARGWTLDYGVMLGEEWPDEIPREYRERYGLSLLRDAEGPRVDPSVLSRARRFAEEGAREVENRIFPIHGL